MAERKALEHFKAWLCDKNTPRCNRDCGACEAHDLLDKAIEEERDEVLQWQPAISKLSLQPGDVVVIRMRGPCTPDVLSYVRNQVLNEFPGYKVIVCEMGCLAEVDSRERVLEEAAKAIDAKHESVTMSEQNGLDIAATVVRSLKSIPEPKAYQPGKGRHD